MRILHVERASAASPLPYKTGACAAAGRADCAAAPVVALASAAIARAKARPGLLLASHVPLTHATLGSARASAAMKCARSSESASPRGSSTWRARKKPVSAKPSARSRPAGCASRLAQEGRQPQHLVGPRLAGRRARPPAPISARHRSRSARAPVAAHCARSRPKPSSAKQLQFETHHHGRGQHRHRRAGRGSSSSADIKARMRIALGQQPHQRGQMGDAIDRVRRGEEIRRAQAHRLHRVIAEMLVEPRPPGRAHAIAGLQHRLHARAEAAAHQPEMAAMLARHQFEDAARLPVPLDAEHDAFIGPLHLLTSFRRAHHDPGMQSAEKSGDGVSDSGPGRFATVPE